MPLRVPRFCEPCEWVTRATREQKKTPERVIALHVTAGREHSAAAPTAQRDRHAGYPVLLRWRFRSQRVVACNHPLSVEHLARVFLRNACRPGALAVGTTSSSPPGPWRSFAGASGLKNPHLRFGLGVPALTYVSGWDCQPSLTFGLALLTAHTMAQPACVGYGSETGMPSSRALM